MIEHLCFNREGGAAGKRRELQLTGKARSPESLMSPRKVATRERGPVLEKAQFASTGTAPFARRTSTLIRRAPR